jgi:hypothetical protein
MCLCSERFYEYQCQNEKASIHIDLNMTKTLSARTTVVQLYTYTIPDFTLLIEHQQIHNGLPSSIRYYHSGTYRLSLGVLKIHEDLSRPKYFLMYFLNQQKINITSSPAYCPHASLLLSEGQFLPSMIIFT